MIAFQLRLMGCIAAAGACAIAQGAAFAQDDGPRSGSAVQAATLIVDQPTLSALGAQTMVDAVIALALERQQSVTVAVVDAGGNLLYFRRMDGAGTGTIGAAIGKARSAAALQAPTQVFSDMARVNPGLALGFVSVDQVILGGGQPIRINGVVVGGIAVSGGAGGEDDLYNDAGLRAVGAQTSGG